MSDTMTVIKPCEHGLCYSHGNSPIYGGKPCPGGKTITLRQANTMTDSWNLLVAGYFDDDIKDGDKIWYVRVEADDE